MLTYVKVRYCQNNVQGLPQSTQHPQEPAHGPSTRSTRTC